MWRVENRNVTSSHSFNIFSPWFRERIKLKWHFKHRTLHMPFILTMIRIDPPLWLKSICNMYFIPKFWFTLNKFFLLPTHNQIMDPPLFLSNTKASNVISINAFPNTLWLFYNGENYHHHCIYENIIPARIECIKHN